MRIVARLPLNRWLPGVLTIEDETGATVLGPYPCRGKADGQIAKAHQNPGRLPWLPFGDHPYGSYRIAAIEADKPQARSYGPFFLLLAPVSGDAARAKINGRVGLAIHGGDPAPGGLADGGLRATEGCLRTTNVAMVFIVAMVKVGDEYVCENSVDTAT